MLAVRRPLTQSLSRWWRAYRVAPDHKVLTGTARGLADLVCVDVVVVRAAFVVLATAGGAGIVLYLVLWVAATVAGRVPQVALEAPTNTDTERSIGFASICLGLLLAVRVTGLGFFDTLVWPVAALAVGFVVAAQQSELDVMAASGVTGDGGSRAWVTARIGGGLILAVVGVVALFAFNVDIGAARDVVLASVVVSIGVSLVLGPWVWRVAANMIDERRNRIRADERTELAAQLHDSVLQTLSLIQRHHDDPAVMVQLARRQERELRSWLHGDGRIGLSERLREGLNTAAADVEEHHGVPIEVVVVGDADADDAVTGLLRAAREAMANAARHSGTSRIDVYAEVGPSLIEVFVRDIGCGFEPSAVPADRRGIRDSIEGRLKRLGGSATITSSAGLGTEIELALPRRPHEADV